MALGWGLWEAPARFFGLRIKIVLSFGRQHSANLLDAGSNQRRIPRAKKTDIEKVRTLAFEPVCWPSGCLFSIEQGEISGSGYIRAAGSRLQPMTSRAPTNNIRGGK